MVVAGAQEVMVETVELEDASLSKLSIRRCLFLLMQMFLVDAGVLRGRLAVVDGVGKVDQEVAIKLEVNTGLVFRRARVALMDVMDSLGALVHLV